MKPPSLLFLLVGLAIGTGPAIGWAQDADDDAQNLPPIYVSSVGGPAGLKAYAPGEWGEVAVVVGNRTQEPQVVQATVQIKGSEELRFSRDVLVPARSVRHSTIPIRLPEQLPPNAQLEILGHVAADSRIPKSEFDGIVRLVSPSDTAYIQDYPISLEPSEPHLDFAYEAALALRAANGLDRRMMLCSERMLPSSYEGWDAVGSVILSGNRLVENPAARQALREWLSKGGCMWIQADKTSIETIRLLLGSAVSIEQVDQVAIHDFAIQHASKNFQGEPTEVLLEQPVQFKRVIADGVDVIYQIDGWPALMKAKVGLGEVYFSMLEGRGLIRPRRSGDPSAKSQQFHTDYISLEPLREVAIGMRPREIPEVVPVDVRAAYVTERIGYKIPSRAFVVGVLLGFCGLIGVAGVGLSYVGWREHLLWVTLAVAGLATATVVAMGVTSHHAVPATASSFQVVEVLPEMDEIATTGSIASYQPKLAAANMSSNGSTRLDPQSPRLTGKIRNMIWTDTNRWRWDKTIMPTGVQLFQFDRFQTLPQPVTATAVFGPQGLTGVVNADGLRGIGPTESLRLADGVLVFPRSQPLAANLTAEGTFSAGIDDLLPPNEFFSSTFVDSTQRQRRAIYQAWYDSYQARLDSTSYLIGWTESLDSGLIWDEDVNVIDGALVAIPLTIQRTVPGTNVSLPGSTLQVQSVVSKSGRSNTFENATSRWIFPYGRSARNRLRFQLPAEALPLRVDSASLFLDCSIPSRMLTIEVIEGEQRRTIIKRANQSGKLTFDLNGPAPLKLDPEGGLTIEFTIGESPPTDDDKAPQASNTWSIRTMRLDVTGTTMQSAEVESQR